MKKNLVWAVALLMIGATTIWGCKDDPIVDPTVKDTEFVESTVKEDGVTQEIIVTVKDYGKGFGTMTLDAHKTYVLDGMVYVNDGQVLTVPAGTIIKGKSGQGENASALVVARGGKIMADGTAAEPIVFTAEADGIHYNHAEAKVLHLDNLPATARGLWGGVIILGKASNNNTTASKGIEGIPTTETRGQYGGTKDDDNSGVLRYVSVRHGGTDIGEGNEINGLTFGSVGSGTTVEYVEVIANKDDAFEFFGSTVNCKYLVAAFSGDDNIDYDESYRGYGQFWFVVQDPNAGDRIGEHDGGPSDNLNGQPYAIPTLYNVTYIGRGATSAQRLITFRDNAGGIYANSIFTNQGKGIDLEYLNGADNSFKQWQDGNLEVKNNIFWNIADNTAAGIFKTSADDPGATLKQTWIDYFGTAMNSVADPGIGVTVSTAGGLNPVPANAVNTDLAPLPSSSFFTQVNYKGAFDPAGANWMLGWTLLDHKGYLN